MSTPDREQRLLLRAVVGDGPQALADWQAWRAAVDFDSLGGESLGLVPLLYRNLQRLGVAAKDTQRYASVYRHNWVANRVAFAAAARGIAALAADGVPTLLLKGAAMTLLYYKDAGVRTMGDVDVLVAREHVTRAVSILQDAGYGELGRDDRERIASPRMWPNRAVTLRHAHGRALDLHWYALADAATPGVDAPFWENARPVDFEGQRTRALAPTDLLYVVLAHGYDSHAPHLRWAADATAILRQASGEIDWPRFVGLARARRMVPAVAAGLRWIRSELGAPVPDLALASLDEAEVSLFDRLEHAHRISPRPDTFSKVLLRLWCWHRRSSEKRGAALAIAFPDFLGRYYGVDAPWRLPLVALRRGVARVRREGL